MQRLLRMLLLTVACATVSCSNEPTRIDEPPFLVITSAARVSSTATSDDVRVSVTNRGGAGSYRFAWMSYPLVGGQPSAYVVGYTPVMQVEQLADLTQTFTVERGSLPVDHVRVGVSRDGGEVWTDWVEVH